MKRGREKGGCRERYKEGANKESKRLLIWMRETCGEIEIEGENWRERERGECVWSERLSGSGIE